MNPLQSPTIEVPQLFYCEQHLQPFIQKHTGSTSNSLSWLKPISAVLVAFTKGQHDYKTVAVSAAGVQYFNYQIFQVPKTYARVYALLGFDGDIFSTSKNTTTEEKRELLASEQIQDTLTYTCLLNGFMRSATQLSMLIKHYNWSKVVFEKLMNEIAKMYVSRHPIEIQMTTKFEELCGWRKATPSVKISSNKAIVFAKQKALPTCQLQPLVHVPERFSAAVIIPKPQQILNPLLYGKQFKTFTDIETVDSDTRPSVLK